MQELTQTEKETVEQYAEGLAKKHGIKKVHVYIAIDEDTDERVVGYFKEPSYVQKLYAMEKIASVGTFTAGEELRQALTLTGEGESDVRIYTEDKYKLAIAGACIALIEVAQNQFKKK